MSATICNQTLTESSCIKRLFISKPGQRRFQVMGKHVVVGLICFDHECQPSCTYNFRKLEKYINFSEDDSSKSRVHSLITFQSKEKLSFLYLHNLHSKIKTKEMIRIVWTINASWRSTKVWDQLDIIELSSYYPAKTLTWIIVSDKILIVLQCI